MGKQPRVPGTRKTLQVPTVRRDLSPEAKYAEQMMLSIGALHAERWLLGQCSIMVAREPRDDEYRWHVSIAHPSRYPDWDEIKTACYSIPALEGVTLAQVLAPGADGPWINLHDNCFHLFETTDPVLICEWRQE